MSPEQGSPQLHLATGTTGWSFLLTHKKLVIQYDLQPSFRNACHCPLPHMQGLTARQLLQAKAGKPRLKTRLRWKSRITVGWVFSIKQNKRRPFTWFHSLLFTHLDDTVLTLTHIVSTTFNTPCFIFFSQIKRTGEEKQDKWFSRKMHN